MEMCFAYDPNERPTFEMLCQELSKMDSSSFAKHGSVLPLNNVEDDYNNVAV